ncbi:MAG: BREX system P-loop protein BrxC, partial [Chloroflexota bacterium]
MQIKELFDSSKDIYRSIEKVITYNASQEARLKAEISEYVVTENIEAQFESLLGKMQLAMQTGGENEVGVWVSGFYGSGKSSFTKYLGLAMDERVTVDGNRFLRWLADRMSRAQTRALLNTVARSFPAAVVLLDLASEMLAGATQEEVSTVLYYKVLQWAGYSRNLKVAAFERRLKRDERYEQFTARIQSELGVDWGSVQNDPLVIDSLIPEIAHELYPELFRSAAAFSTETADFVRFENERVKEMIDIVREASGKEYILFVVDEVGQYVASRPNLILNLDGLAKNLKSIGGGKAWIIATAQQRLMEDDPRASLNSPELYKLKDRFPISIDLESSDIREICYKRLLGKSAPGEATLGQWFDQYGQALRYNTRLQDARYYDADFDKRTFTNLYPFLPAHFDILLHLLGALARSTGGIGLRSAIKVIQDILIEGPAGQAPVANRPLGWLATTVTLYDALEKDIRRAAEPVHKGVAKAQIRFDGSPLHIEIAKTVAVLQILGNMPVTVQNVAALMHPAVEAPSRLEAVQAAVDELIADGLVPFGVKDGSLYFFSEKINDIEQERARITLKSSETRRIQSTALRQAFDPLPSVKLHNTFTVTAGLKAQVGGQTVNLAGENNTIQLVVELAAPDAYEAVRARLASESIQNSARHTIFLLGPLSSKIGELTGEIYRSQEIANLYRNDPAQEVKEYCAAQTEHAQRQIEALERQLAACLGQGSFIFRNQTTASESLDPVLAEAARKLLQGVAGQVFYRYGEAPVRAETGLAEKFLKEGNLKNLGADKDPLGLVEMAAGTPRINSSHKALVSVCDYLERSGGADGKHLSEHFSDAPFGWSPDTLRYLAAALLVNGSIKLKVSGKEIKVSGQQAIEALRSNQAFKAVGVALRDGQLPAEVLARAAERLTGLVGETVVPLEQEISQAAVRSFPGFQNQYAPLAQTLKHLGLPGVERMQDLTQVLAEVLETDGSDVPQRLGSEESSLYAALKWAGQVRLALHNGLERTVGELNAHRQDIGALPDSGIPGDLRRKAEAALGPALAWLGQQSFHEHAPEINAALTAVKNLARDAAQAMAGEQAEAIQAAQVELQQAPGWDELTYEEQAQTLGELEGLAITVPESLAGLKLLLNQQFTLQNRLAALKKQVARLGQERRRAREEEERRKRVQEGKPRLQRVVCLPVKLCSSAELEALIQELLRLKDELASYSEIEIDLSISE